MHLLPLPRSKVKLGVALPWSVRDAGCNLLLSRGHVIESDRQLDALLERGAFVDVEEIKAASLHVAISSGSTVTTATSLFGLWEHTTTDMFALLAKAPHMPNLPDRINDFALSLIALIDKDVDIALYRTVRQDRAVAFYYGYDHCIHTATLCLLIARHLQWSEAKTMSLFKAALTMNMPILSLQGKMADQNDPVLDSQRAMIRKHPMEAFDWLTASGVTDPDWLLAVQQHHEHADATGYPQGLAVQAEIAIALRVADVFMAKISPRRLRPALTVKDAERQLLKEDHGGPLSGALIKVFGIYPPGDIVKLASGEIGVVMRRSASAKCPIVAAITDVHGKPTVKTIQRDTSQAAYAILGNVADNSLAARMPPERIYGYARAGG